MNAEVEEYLKQADRAVTVAETLFDAGFEAEAAARAYYAMFYAAQALLKANSIQRTKHSAVQAAFGQYFVKTGKIAVQFHRMFLDAQETREVADYAIEEEISRDTAALRIQNAMAFIEEIKTSIAKQEGGGNSS